MQLEEMIRRCQEHADKQQYCWFRMSYAVIGGSPPSWVVWFEGLGLNWRDDHTKGSPTLQGALEKLLSSIQ